MEGGPLVEIVYNYSLLPLCQGGVFRSGINQVQFFFSFLFLLGNMRGYLKVTESLLGTRSSLMQHDYSCRLQHCYVRFFCALCQYWEGSLQQALLLAVTKYMILKRTAGENWWSFASACKTTVKIRNQGIVPWIWTILQWAQQRYILLMAHGDEFYWGVHKVRHIGPHGRKFKVIGSSTWC